MARILDNVNLICIPHAGGNKYSYNSFIAVAPIGINVTPIELPGRGDRLNEPLLSDLNSMVDDLFTQLKNYIDKPYIIYGHSMGALLGYLVTKKINTETLPLPQHLILTGHEGPSVKNKKLKFRSRLPTKQFIDELRVLGGIPEEILEDKSFLDFFEPILRADFKAIEDYKYFTGTPLNIPICVIYSTEDDISAEEAWSWQVESSFDVELIQFPGDHFFIFKHQEQILNIVKKIAS